MAIAKFTIAAITAIAEVFALLLFSAPEPSVQLSLAAVLPLQLYLISIAPAFVCVVVAFAASSPKF